MNAVNQLKTVKGSTQTKIAAELTRTGGLLRLAPAWVPRSSSSLTAQTCRAR